MRLSALDRKVLNCIQKDIPLEPQPFKILSKRLGIKEEELIRRVEKLKKRGIIRSFAASLNHKKLKFTSSLIALKAPLNKLKSITKKITKYPEVTHCYLRKGEYNLWTVFLCLEKRKLSQFINRLAKEIGRENILNLPTRKQFKLKTKLKV